LSTKTVQIHEYADILLNIYLCVLAAYYFTAKCWLLPYTEKKFTRFLDFFYHTFLGLELGTLFPARESLVSDIPNGDRNIATLFYSVAYSFSLCLACTLLLSCTPLLHSCIFIGCCPFIGLTLPCYSF